MPPYLPTASASVSLYTWKLSLISMDLFIYIIEWIKWLQVLKVLKAQYCFLSNIGNLTNVCKVTCFVLCIQKQYMVTRKLELNTDWKCCCVMKHFCSTSASPEIWGIIKLPRGRKKKKKRASGLIWGQKYNKQIELRRRGANLGRTVNS